MGGGGTAGDCWAIIRLIGLSTGEPVGCGVPHEKPNESKSLPAASLGFGLFGFQQSGVLAQRRDAHLSDVAALGRL